MRGEMRKDASQQRGFDFEIFGDGFNDPVALGELGQIVVEVAGSDEADEGWLKEERPVWISRARRERR